MVLLGTLVNGAAIIVGSLLGLVFHNIPERYKTTIMQALALAVMLLGIQMGLASDQFLIVIGSLVIGGWIGERIQLEDMLNRLGKWIEKRSGAGESEGAVAKAFVTATLVYVVGAMAVLGALDSGLRLDHNVLYTKSMLDGFTAVLFTATLGFGVAFSFIPVVLYQGSIALLAGQIDQFVPVELREMFITEMTGTGGIMILGIGLKLAGILDIRVANLLPAIPVVGAIVTVIYLL